MELERGRVSTRAARAAQRSTHVFQRNAIILILRHLLDRGYRESYDALCRESGISLQKFDVAANMSLSHVLKGFEIGYELQYDTKPMVVCAATNENLCTTTAGRSHTQGSLPPIAPGVPTKPRHGMEANSTGTARANEQPSQAGKIREPKTGRTALTLAHISDSTYKTRPHAATRIPDLTIQAQRCSLNAQEDRASPDSDPDEFFERQVTKDIPAHFVGLTGAKGLLIEAVVQPVKYPDLFTGLLAPWRGVLIFGPPGTGKTLLAKAVATECKTTFYNVSASMVISKWRGDSEKLIRILFEMARHHAPSTIFIDEIDALCSSRGGEGEHEASRRMKTELLTQMDGLAQANDHVFVLAATNLPWELDHALLRRLEKRILVGLPCADARARMLKTALHDRASPDIDFGATADRMTMYSGSDVMQVAKEAAMRPLRRMVSTLESGGTKDCHMGPVTPDDIWAAFAVVQSTASTCETKYKDFATKYGSNASD